MTISKDNFVMMAMKSYDNPASRTLIEFEDDLAKFSNLVRLCSKETDPIIAHLTLNLVVILLNIFEPKTCIEMMFFKVKKEDRPKLKAVLLYPNRVTGNYHEEIESCQTTTNILVKI